MLPTSASNELPYLVRIRYCPKMADLRSSSFSLGVQNAPRPSRYYSFNESLSSSKSNNSNSEGNSKAEADFKPEYKRRERYSAVIYLPVTADDISTIGHLKFAATRNGILFSFPLFWATPTIYADSGLKSILNTLQPFLVIHRST